MVAGRSLSEPDLGVWDECPFPPLQIFVGVVAFVGEFGSEVLDPGFGRYPASAVLVGETATSTNYTQILLKNYMYTPTTILQTQTPPTPMTNSNNHSHPSPKSSKDLNKLETTS